jgi:hypothetical protein
MRLRQGPIPVASRVQGNAAEPGWSHEDGYDLRVRDRSEAATASGTAAGSVAHPLRATDPAVQCPASPKRGWPRGRPLVCG